MQRLIVGPDFAFGKDRIGDIKFLTQNQNLFDYELSVVDTYKKDSEIVSSTKIKKLIVSGEIEKANSYLGKPYNIEGKIIRGKGRGKKLNMPTANLDYKKDPRTISRKDMSKWSEKRKKEYMAAAKSEAREFQRKEALKAPPSRKQAIREHLKNEAGKKVAPVRKKHNKYYK